MDDYDAPSMRFSNDNDFEGGEYGSDGEFYALGQKKGKQQSKRSALYGVFDDSSEDEGTSRGKRPNVKKDYSAPLGFVSGGLKGSALEEEQLRKAKGEGKDDDDDDEDEEEEEE
eukprot:CAMPEP_0177739490 /NCGR_PEP_ID=MMETSP0484_2-20121128/27056_1 /TAXON_ID=354590 /ORGANISM="Rhodomonas lens, Strain RHODO" /LENGTH=113 /DNA_ID=CAMNT_0019253561 /DNA_START=122 /DNA_END=460 /DNA_ORIENTATION=-